MPVEQVHERTGEDEDKWCVGENVLPVPDESTYHDDGEDVIEPVRDAEMLHNVATG